MVCSFLLSHNSILTDYLLWFVHCPRFYIMSCERIWLRWPQLSPAAWLSPLAYANATTRTLTYYDVIPSHNLLCTQIHSIHRHPVGYIYRSKLGILSGFCITGACGKTSLLCCFALGEFPKEYVSESIDIAGCPQRRCWLRPFLSCSFSCFRFLGLLRFHSTILLTHTLELFGLSVMLRMHTFRRPLPIVHPLNNILTLIYVPKI